MMNRGVYYRTLFNLSPLISFGSTKREKRTGEFFGRSHKVTHYSLARLEKFIILHPDGKETNLSYVPCGWAVYRKERKNHGT